MSCQKYFEISHEIEEIVPIYHPNQYFEQSKRILDHRKTVNNGSTHKKIEITP